MNLVLLLLLCPFILLNKHCVQCQHEAESEAYYSFTFILFSANDGKKSSESNKKQNDDKYDEKPERSENKHKSKSKLKFSDFFNV